MYVRGSSAKQIMKKASVITWLTRVIASSRVLRVAGR